MMSIIAHNVSQSFDGGVSFALKNVNLNIEAGEMVAIIGPSGSGKTTLFRAINGSRVPVSGTLTVLGKNVGILQGRELSALRKKIGFIFQQFNLVKNLTVLQNVLMGRVASIPLWRSLLGFFPKRDVHLAKEILESFGLKGREHEKVRHLSGGQQQRVAIARALVQEPEIILADEPMASLDPRKSEMILRILREIHDDKGITILVNIHVLDLAKRFASRIIALNQGEVVFDGPPSALDDAKVDAIYSERKQS